jgi:diacylglycerol kinase family enzyme
MVPEGGSGRAGPGRAERWLARLALAGLAAAAAVLLLAGALRSVTALLAGAVCLVVCGGAAWWFIARRGLMRWLAGLVLVAAPAGAIALYVLAGLLWEVLLSLALTAGAALTGRAALAAGRPGEAAAAVPAAAPRRPYLIMNPRSGGGTVGRTGLAEAARRRGAQVVLLDDALLAGAPDGAEPDRAQPEGMPLRGAQVDGKPADGAPAEGAPAEGAPLARALLDDDGRVDVAALARGGLSGGADLLGVAGGDGTQALVAGVAADRDIPMVVIAAGTRNHFALDLGLDRGDPVAGLAALDEDGQELRIDLGEIAGCSATGWSAMERTFVNNASFGAYAQVVQSPAYREDKAGTALDMLPGLLDGHEGPRLRVLADGREVLDGPQAVLVSNNPYQTGDIAGLGRRARLDTGLLGVVGVHVRTGRGGRAGLPGPGSVTVLTAREVIVEADAARVPVGVDGEALVLRAPVRCVIVPRALRVRVPARRPGVTPPMDWGRLLDWARLRRDATGIGARRGRAS